MDKYYKHFRKGKMKTLLLTILMFSASVFGFAAPVVSYSFDRESDDGAEYPLEMKGSASIVSLTDGNRVLSTGTANGYVDLGSSMGNAVLSQLRGDYSLHLDLCIGSNNSLSRFCWAFALANGTNQYVGLVNAAGNGNWYYEIKNGTAYQAKSQSGLSAGAWHSVTIVQSGNSNTIYIDGVSKATSTIGLKPSSIASVVSQCWLGRSPFSGDAYMTNTLIDNFSIYAEALSSDEVNALYESRPSSTEILLTDDEKAVLARKQLDGALAARYIHKRLALPTTCSYGSVKWIYSENVADYLKFNNNVFTVQKRDEVAVTTGTLQGVVTIDGKDYDVFAEPLPVVVAPDDNAVGYLYCHMPDRVPQPGVVTLVSQTITYALGKASDNGLVFHELNEGDGIISGIGTSLPWCRDAFFAKDPVRKCYYIVTTDLFGSLDNGTSMLWNYSIGMFRSFDLINWSYSRCDIKQYLQNNPPTDIYDNSGTRLLTAAKVSRVWAPQIIFIDGDPYIYYAVGNTDNGNCDHFYISKANANFSNITSFQMLYGPNMADNNLDADIVYLPTDQLYHMSYRDYAAGDIRDITCSDLLNPEWSVNPVTSFADGSGFEASSVFRRINDDVWNVGNVNYSSNRGFHFHTADAMLRNLQPAANLSGNLSPQHGSFVMINQTEWNVLQGWSDLKGMIKKAKALMAAKPDANVKKLVTRCEKDITTSKGRSTDMEALAATIQADLNELRVALEETYPVLSPEEINLMKADATKIKITNGTFGSNANGWTCSPSPTVREGVGEFFAAYYVDYSATMEQTLDGLEEGDYLVCCQAFERNGHNDRSGHAASVGAENLHFRLFANADETPVASLYSLPYTGAGSLGGFVDNMTAANTMFSRSADNFLCGVVTHVGADGSLKFGIKSATHTIHTSNWCCFDNFQVYRLSDTTPIQNVTVSPDSDELQNATNSDKIRFFSLDGRRISQPREGVNIVILPDGRVVKTVF